MCSKSIHNFSIPELGETYLTLHQEYPDLKGHTLDTKVPEFLELPIKFSYVAHYLELGRKEALLDILEDETEGWSFVGQTEIVTANR